MDAEGWMAVMMNVDGDEISLEVHREYLQRGRTFSVEAMDELTSQLVAFVGSRIMRRWNATDEPPSVVSVDMKVTVG